MSYATKVRESYQHDLAELKQAGLFKEERYIHAPQGAEIEVEFPAGATVSYETSDREVDIHQQVWVLSGQIEVSVGGETHHLEAGDCLALCLDQPITYRNRTVRSTRYAVVIVAGQTSSRRTA